MTASATRRGRYPAPVERQHDAVDELVARAQEAGLFASALRTVIRQLEAVLVSPVSEVPIEAFALTAQLRSMGDRYERRWEDQS
jgi:hypothetical protein